jgi:3-methyladenine DNA glycosylase AlkD
VFELAKAFVEMDPGEIEKLLESDIHEARAGAVSVMSKQYNLKQQSEVRRHELYALYLRRHDRINNWDLADLGAYYVVGSWLADKPRDVLYMLAKSKNPWERRTAILATFAFIREGDYADTYAIAELLLKDKVELVQKAVGWMLRTTGNDRPRLHAYLDKRAAAMPRAMLRAAIEKLDPAMRQHYLRLGKDT